MKTTFLHDFPPPRRFAYLTTLVPDNCCGSVSIMAIFEKFGLPYDPDFIVKESRDGNATTEYPVSGSNILGSCLAMLKTGRVDVELYSDIDFKTVELDPHEKVIADELLQQKGFSYYRALLIDEILEKITDDCVPIMSFFRDGDLTKGHSSPLRGITNNQLLLPFFDPGYPNCNCDKETFVKTWWNEQTLHGCILVKRRLSETANEEKLSGHPLNSN